ncbi:ParA family protein [Nostoc sphaeroides CHAB 2801]|uniref:ParA family protein n=1 Tax=Nostoc sphaeroides TaxID=446679 RepID=UPI001E37162D|nr:ParA family protein [Nostoc sphaeroides]MCC5634114.1 ParA family protein [Nostoc sphaeroides CHAB 2801]
MSSQKKIVTITGYKGGVGKSTTAVHLATFFSELGKTVLVDGDQNRTALAWSKRGSFPFPAVDERQALKVIADAQFVVIDTPARPDSDDLKELAKGCDLLILPTKPDIVSLEPMLLMVKDLGETNYCCLLTIVPPYPSKEGETLRQDLLNGGIPVFEAMIRRTVGFEKAAMAGVPIRDVEDSRLKTAWADYLALGKEVMEILK